MRATKGVARAGAYALSASIILATASTVIVLIVANLILLPFEIASRAISGAIKP